jgi:hypothetical protein
MELTFTEMGKFVEGEKPIVNIRFEIPARQSSEDVK